jgi:nucleosome assembly protein 1-like 1
MDDAAELVPRKFVGSSIEWAPGKDTTVAVVKKRVKKDKKGGVGGGAPAATVSRTEPCDSFFNFFRTPEVPENPEELGEEELDKLQEVCVCVFFCVCVGLGRFWGVS